MSGEFSSQVRALQSDGTSNEQIYQAALDLLAPHLSSQTVLVDVGCGRKGLLSALGPRFGRYIGVDVIDYPTSGANLPPSEFVACDLDSKQIDLPDATGDAVCCIETIEHVENPRALMRELSRILKPQGMLLVTTPNQLSLSSKLCLFVRNEFLHFQEVPGSYPAHISALLEIDLIRIARENNLVDIRIGYTGSGRIPLTAHHWPAWMNARSGWLGRAFSDNILLACRKS